MESTTLQEEASLLLASVECSAATFRLGPACVVKMWHFVSCPFRVCSSCLFYGVLLGGLDPRHQAKRGPRSLASVRAVVFASIFELAFIVGYFCFDQRVIGVCSMKCFFLFHGRCCSSECPQNGPEVDVWSLLHGTE